MSQHIPFHVGIIPDGNRRWAKQRGLSPLVGHTQGFENVKRIAKKARQLGIRALTFWGFSTENWKRSKGEVSHLMNMAEKFIKTYWDEAVQNEVRVIHLGRKDRLRTRLRDSIEALEERTKAFTKYYLAFALDYGGQDEIIRAIKKIAKTHLSLTRLTPQVFESFLDGADLPHPNPDLIIRTSGEKRLSGFMLWYSAYAEIAFVNKHFPDFSPADLTRCVNDYAKRERRFGQ